MASEHEQKDLSAAEWKVMKIVWDLKKGMAREIYTVAGEEHGWTPPTVKTLLKRLVDKGYLQTTTVGNGFVYRPARSAIAILKSAANTLLEHTIDSATGPLLAHMVDTSDLDEADLEQLQQLIERKKKSISKSQRQTQSSQE
jgi:BlaI family transcriptional regulator, penicillinase repressor